jgi:hypothetical protein
VIITPLYQEKEIECPYNVALGSLIIMARHTISRLIEGVINGS